VLQCVVVCVTVCCIVLQRVAVCWSVLHGDGYTQTMTHVCWCVVAACCSVLKCVLQCTQSIAHVLGFVVAVCGCVMQCDAV